MAMTAQDASMWTPERRTAFYYFTMFLSPGVAGAYFAIWLSDKGISSGDIGIINSVPVFILMVMNLFVGRIADRAPDWRSVIIGGSLIAGLVPLALFAVDGFWGILIVWTLAVVPFTSVAPVADAAAVRMTRRNGTDYATIRGWGTGGYMVGLAGIGYLVSVFGSWAFLPALVAVSLMRAGASLILPRFRAPEGQIPVPGAVAARSLKEVMKPWLLLPVFGFALIMSTMLVLNAFAALVWKNDGVPEQIIGPLLALGALSEMATLFLFSRLGKRFTARHLILIAAAVSAVRWTIMAFSPPVWVLVLLQLTHGISFGFGFLGVVNFIANWTSEDMAAEVQSLSVMLQQAVTVIVLAGFGFLMEGAGAGAFLGTAVLCGIGASFVLISLRLRSSKSEAGSDTA